MRSICGYGCFPRLFTSRKKIGKNPFLVYVSILRFFNWDVRNKEIIAEGVELKLKKKSRKFIVVHFVPFFILNVEGWMLLLFVCVWNE